MKPFKITLFLLAITCTAQAQKWNVEAPPGPSKKVTINTTEGH
jgi:hypothetical protein